MTPAEARTLLPSLERQLWLQHAGGSPMSTRVHAAVRDAADLALAGMDWAERYAADRQALREVLARLVGGTPDEIVLTRNTGHGLSLLAFGLDWRSGDNIVGARWEFPTNLYPWMAQERHGVQLRLVEPVDGRVTAEAVEALIDDRTRVVALSLVQFWNGYRIDVDRIGDVCRRHGVLFALDAMQALPVVPLNVSDTPVDLVAAGAIKWLMGPVGIGFAWLRRGLLSDLHPPLVGVGSVAHPHAYFEPALDFAPGGKRFEEGAVSWFDIVGFLAAAALLEEVGFAAVSDRVLDLSEKLALHLDAEGFEVVEPWPRKRVESSGIVSFRRPGTPHEELLARLDAAGITAGSHRDFVRLSPHFYNDESDLDRAVTAMTSPR